MRRTGLAGLGIAALVLFCAGAAWATGGGLVKTLDVPNMQAAVNDQYERGIAYGDGHVWISADDFGTHVQIFKVHPNGSVVAQWELGIAYGQHLTDLQWVDDQLYFVTNYSKLFSFDPATAEVSEILTLSFWPKGLTWDGKYWWMAKGNLGTDNMIVKIDPATGAILQELSIMSGNPFTNPMGMTWDGKYLYLAVRESQEDGSIVIKVIDPSNGKVFQTFKAGIQTVATGVAFDGYYLWTVSPWEDKLFKVHAVDTDGDNIGDAVDCAPNDPDANQDSPETCDGKDNNCNGLLDGDDPGLVVPLLPCEKQKGVCYGAVKSADNCIGGSWQACITTNYLKVSSNYMTTDALCDGIDNDCDGIADNGMSMVGKDGTKYVGVGIPCGVGICKGGFTACKADKTGTYCTSEASAYPEFCDGLDNNCDGIVDGFTLVLLDGRIVTKPNEPCGAGACAGGTTQCTENKLAIICPSEDKVSLEKCDNIDNDCDGKLDGLDPIDVAKNDPKLCEKQISVCKNSLKLGHLCVAGVWGACDEASYKANSALYQHSLEVACDGIDNDCDGQVDEDFAVTLLNGSVVTGVGTPCGAGICAGGVTACNPAKTGIYCTTESKAAPEICDALDNDCDGKLDAADPQDLLKNQLMNCENQNGVCKGSTKPAALCSAGKWQVCVDATYSAFSPLYTAGKELKCDSFDNDCNAQVDEDFTMTQLNGGTVTGAGTACGVGVCAGGAAACYADQSGIYCPTEAKASAELCDAKDNDCDGKTDSDDPADLEQADVRYCEVQKGVCMGSRKPAYLCKNAVWTACAATEYKLHTSLYQDGVETACDTLDNDCSGNFDEDFTVTLLNGSSVSGVSTPCGVGACAGGLTVCNAAKNGVLCNTESKASSEVCDNVDNDCDGKMDAADAADLVVKDVQMCENQSGVCKGAKKPAALCQNGQWKACTDTEYIAFSGSYQSGTEKSCDGLDNDCNGNNDEDFSMTGLNGASFSGIGSGCGVGACAGGVTTCKADKTGIYCPTEANASGEKCDNIDNDCDGKLDAADPTDLLANDKKSCEKQSGVCSGSSKPTTLCSGGVWQTCPDSVYAAYSSVYQAAKETTCEGTDNDCDGAADDDFTMTQLNGATVTGAGKACGVGLCSGGTTACTAAKTGIYCPNESKAVVEKCDNVDNDCDGKLDAADPTDLVANDLRSCENQKGVCKNSTKPASLCVSGGWQACTNTQYAAYSGSFQAGTETSCDALDNDCDGSSDEDFTVTLKNGSVVGFNAPCGVGVCAGGITACNAAKTGIYCPTEASATGEKCNAKDDDCDGLTDAADPTDLLANDSRLCENQSGVCSGVKKEASKCVNGSWQACGYDNDGDGHKALASCGSGSDDLCDNDASGWLDKNTDADGDGHAPKTGVCPGGKVRDDCNDSCNTCYPGSTQFTCAGDSKDQDCDGSVDEWDYTGWSDISGNGPAGATMFNWLRDSGKYPGGGCAICNAHRLRTNANFIKNWWGSGLWQSCSSPYDSCNGSCDKSWGGEATNAGFGVYSNQCTIWGATSNWSTGGVPPVDGWWNSHNCCCQSWWCCCGWYCYAEASGRYAIEQTRGAYRR